MKRLLCWLGLHSGRSIGYTMMPGAFVRVKSQVLRCRRCGAVYYRSHALRGGIARG